MPKLRYHQATYDLLTKDYIDPSRFVERFGDTNYITQEIDFDFETEGNLTTRQMPSWANLNLHNRPIQFSAENIAKLDAIEAKYNTTIPASVREWYSLDIIPAIMSATHEFSYSLIEEIKPASEEKLFALQNPNNENYWFFLCVQGHHWEIESSMFQIGKKDNPLVLTEHLNGYKRLDGQPVNENFQKPSSPLMSFSKFIYFYFWRWLMDYQFQHYFHIGYIPYEMSPPTILSMPPKYYVPLDKIRQTHEELSYQRNGKRFFEDKHTRLEVQLVGKWIDGTIRKFEDQLGGGVFRADSTEALRKLVTQLWGNDAPIMTISDVTKDLQALKEKALIQLLQHSGNWIKISKIWSRVGVCEELISELIASGQVEAHPDNSDNDKPNLRYRLRRED